MSRPTLKSFKKEAFKRKGVKVYYDTLSPAYEIWKKPIALRLEARFTQEQVAEKLHTNKSNISRLESVESEILPKLPTLTDYAEAIGYRLRIDFVSIKL
ncbi:MAG: helix-turn-helix domain-containing protein [Pseudomonadales bacterium]|nr:helix-turn-helix domain-containing protein [Pseudomonadales bacterium]